MDGPFYQQGNDGELSGGRVSTKRAKGKKTGSNHFAGAKMKHSVKKETNQIHRQNERQFSREVIQAYRAGGELPMEPAPTVGGFYLY